AAAAHLEHLWVEPQRMRQGVGSALLGMACREVREAGHAWLELVADPNAVGFYRRHGALKVGEVLGRVLDTPRVLPRMRMPVR
ncbi:MAG: GNAT family N-acetyltransferase, partial [Steroidobacteraceae bacterium]